ncbi:MAG: hypothetical protein ACXWWU_02150 [Candidatus Limnocylindria bacterium]
MVDQPQLIYLEPDDEITSVVRRLRAAESGAVVIVAPGRSRATSSAVALRLLAQVAAEEARSISLVADAPTRAVATEAGIPAFASVSAATSGTAAPDEAAATPRAPIRVVRGASEAAALSGAALPAARSGQGDETVAVRLPTPPTAGGKRRPPGRGPVMPRWPWVALPLIVVLAIGAALLPGATVRVAAATTAVGPRSYQLRLSIAGRQSAQSSVTSPGTATGQRIEAVAASGSITFSNWNTVAVEVPQGTHVSVGGTIVFSTVKRIVVQRGRLTKSGIQPSEARVDILAVELGLTGNVAAGAIDTIDDKTVRDHLRGFPENTSSLVTNPEATSGGVETPHPVIQQADVDAVVETIKAELATHVADALAGQPDRIYAGPPATEVPVIVVAPDLVGTEDTPTFSLTGTLAFDRPYVSKPDVEQAAHDALLADATAAPSETTIIPASIAVTIGTVTVSGDEMSVQVSVQASAAAGIDTAAIRDLIAGMTVQEARAALRDIGEIEVDLWPAWLDRLPRIAFRISVETVLPSAAASPSP